MSAIKLLRTGDEPTLKVGDHIMLKGVQWDKSQANTVFRVVKAEQTHYRYDLGIMSTSGTNSDVKLSSEDWIRPYHSDVIFEIRLRIIGPATLYMRFPSGQIRGGLDYGKYTTPNPDDTEMRLLGGYTEKDLRNYRLRVIEGYRHGPDFEFKNFVNDGKVIMDMIITEMQVEEDPHWKGEVIEFEDDKEMRW